MSARLLICGSAPCLHDDLAQAARRPGKVMAVNTAAAILRADYIFTVHPEIMARLIKEQNARRGFNWPRRLERHYETICVPPKHGALRRESFPVSLWHEIPQRMATSGWAAIYSGIYLGYTEIVLCGVPLTGGDGVVEGCEMGVGGKHPDGPTIRRIQQRAREYAAELAATYDNVRVHSMSGYTREILGPPEYVLSDNNQKQTPGARHGGEGQQRQ